MNAVEKALEYNEKYGNIPKDYMERLAWLYNEYKFKPKDLANLLKKIDKLANTSWKELKYIFYMKPSPTPRARMNPNTFVFYVSGAKMNKDIYEEFHKHHSVMTHVISTPCRLSTELYMETPASMTMEEKVAAELKLLHHVMNPDWDNLGKTYSDMVQSVLVSNDSIVFRGEVEKFYSILPRVEITIQYMTEYDCKYNKRTIEKRKSFQDNPLTKKDLDYII